MESNAPYGPLTPASPINSPSTAKGFVNEVHSISPIHRLVLEFFGGIACETNDHGDADVGSGGGGSSIGKRVYLSTGHNMYTEGM